MLAGRRGHRLVWVAAVLSHLVPGQGVEVGGVQGVLRHWALVEAEEEQEDQSWKALEEAREAREDQN